MEKGKFYIVDCGKCMTEYADLIMATLKENGHHYINYLTDQDYFLAVEELTEDEFLDHYKNTIK